MVTMLLNVPRCHGDRHVTSLPLLTMHGGEGANQHVTNHYCCSLWWPMSVKNQPKISLDETELKQPNVQLFTFG